MIDTYVIGDFGEATAPPIAAIEEKLAAKRLKLLEHYVDHLGQDPIDPYDAFRDERTGLLWRPVGQNGDGALQVGVQNEQQLTAVRDQSRLLALANEFAINAFENRVSYIVGSGHSYTVAAAPGAEPAEETIQDVQDVLDKFVKEAKWAQRQQETQHRLDRDGEVFLRFFVGPSGMPVIRFVEPGQVATPPEAQAIPNHSFGIITAPEDVETVDGYYVSGELVPADQIQHRKANVDSNVKRGMPLLYPVEPNLRRADKILRNMSTAAEIQTAIAMIRKQPGTASGINTMLAADADHTYTERHGAYKTRHIRDYKAGTIMDVPQSTEYDFPAQGIDASRFVAVLQSELRATASRLVMPEFMLSSDASNANYSSTMVAEGPAVKNFERLQWGVIADDLEVLDRVLSLAVESGMLTAEAVEQTKIDAEPPRLATRNRGEEVDADMKLVNGKVMSIRTAQIRNELDPDTETEEIDATREKNDPFAGMENPLFTQGQGGGDDEDDEDE
jgi:hypothetical protein